MLRKISLMLFVVALSLTAALPALADAPATGTVFEGDRVPGIALGDTRAEVDAVNGPPRSCRSNNDPPTMESCSFDVQGGGWVSVFYQGTDGGDAAGSPDDVVSNIRWGGEEVGWVTTAGVTTELAKYNKQAAVDAYPNANLTYDSVGRLVRLHDPGLGVQVAWNHAYIFYTISMSIFAPYTPPPPPDLIRVADIEMSYDRRSVTARILVLDEDDQPVEGAVVSGEFTGSKSGPVYPSGTTDANGTVVFTIDKAHRGVYRITITRVVKEGYKWDYDGSIRVASITKPK
jgi:hypothetical protein